MEYEIGNLLINNSTLDNNEITRNYKTSFKAAWNQDALYLFFQIQDPNSISDLYVNRLEIMWQPRDIYRYEKGYQLASDINQKNQQYQRFIELGGNKSLFTRDGINESVSVSGQDGMWKPSLQEYPNDYRWMEEQDGSEIKAILILRFEEQMRYMIDEWGEANPGNIDYKQPNTTDSIAFDIFSTTQHDFERIQLSWNTFHLEGYALNYYSGFLVFDEDGFEPGHLPYDHIGLCLGSEEKPIELNKSNVKWYSDTTNLIYSTEPPVPPTHQLDTLEYIYTTTVNTNESDFKILKVIVYNIDLLSQESISGKCGSSVIVNAAVLNNLNNEEVEYTWNLDDSIFTGNSIGFAISDEDSLSDNETTGSGCFSSKSIPINPLLETQQPYILKTDAWKDKNIVRISVPEESLADNIVLQKALNWGMFEDFVNIYPGNPVSDIWDTLDYNFNEVHQYRLKITNQCNSEYFSVTHSPVRLKSEDQSSTLVKLVWENYVGRKTHSSFLYRGYDPDLITRIYEGHGETKEYMDKKDPVDTLYYQLVSGVNYDSKNPDTENQLVHSSIIKVAPSGIFVDTVVVYDTVMVFVSVTDTLVI
jgi:hypothetical protein